VCYTCGQSTRWIGLNQLPAYAIEADRIQLAMTLRTTIWLLLTLLILPLAACQPVPATQSTATPPSTPASAPAPEELVGLERFSDLSADHVSGSVTYEQTPPVGGPHNPIWQNCGIYDQPVPNEQAVHSLEHGAAWITYQPDLAADDVALLRDLVQGNAYVLLSPYEGLPAPVVASAWGLQLQLDGADDARLPVFIDEFANGPQTPEPGAPCNGGTGTPVG
jgi:hypothetical protein